MKREGWQHGKVRFNPKSVKHPESESAAAAAAVGFRSKLLPKPTNSSKFTGKCPKARCKSCHRHPVSKSKDKAKGSYKLKSCDVALNHRLVSWRIVDGGRAAGLDHKGISATALLGRLSSNSWHEEEDEEAEYHNDCEAGHGAEYGYGDYLAGPEEFDTGCGYDDDEGDHGLELESGENEAKSVDKIVECSDDKEEEAKDVDEEEEEEEEEGDMGFYMVGIAWEFSDGEEDWLVVEEI